MMKKQCMSAGSGRQQGWLDIQMNMVLVIAGLLGGMALLAGLSYINSAKADALYSGHRQIVNDIRGAYQHAQSFSGLSASRVVTLKALPRTWIRGTAIENNMGGTVQISPVTVTNSNDSFEIEHAGLNENECNDFVNTIYPETISISVGGTPVKSQGDVNLNVGTLATACDNASNTVAGVYSKY